MVKDILFVTLLIFTHYVACQDRESAPIIYAIDGKLLTLPCTAPNRNTTLITWKFLEKGTEREYLAAVLYSDRREYSVFPPFDKPFGRTRISGGNLIIKNIKHSEEGNYWCEISRVNASTVIGPRHPVHVYVTPQDEVTALENDLLIKNQSSTPARCISRGGNPAAKVTWFNGTESISILQTIVEVNQYKDYLRDSFQDLLISSPTRYDHNRTFSCVIEHPAYEEPKVLNYTVLVNYPPENITIWANVTSKIVYCRAYGGYPESSYRWSVPGGSRNNFTNSFIEVPNLLNLPDFGEFSCTASNGFPLNLTTSELVEDLVYPYEQANPHSLHPLVIIGLMLVFAFILALIIYGVSRKLR